ncbi:uncharacterized protein LOC142978336 [Anticarsia gemmatalis]|uniref:uncharacterized protein LOC142978336 n=1 Tax=Anticarsia gemmatalis TaxID=129554 RepID=UPI003F761CC7
MEFNIYIILIGALAVCSAPAEGHKIPGSETEVYDLMPNTSSIRNKVVNGAWEGTEASYFETSFHNKFQPFVNNLDEVSFSDQFIISTTFKISDRSKPWCAFSLKANSESYMSLCFTPASSDVTRITLFYGSGTVNFHFSDILINEWIQIALEQRDKDIYLFVNCKEIDRAKFEGNPDEVSVRINLVNETEAIYALSKKTFVVTIQEIKLYHPTCPHIINYVCQSIFKNEQCPKNYVASAIRQLTDSIRKDLKPTTQTAAEDECDIIGRLVAKQLRELPLEHRLNAHKEIQDVLTKHRLNHVQ